MNDENFINLLEKNKDIIYTESFFNMLKDTSLLEFRKIIDLVQNIRPSLLIENKVKEYYLELLEKYNDNSKLFLEYEEIIKNFWNNDLDFLNSYNEFNYFVDRDLVLKLQDFSHYSDRMKLVYEELKSHTNLKISEIIIDGLFGDTIYNVWLNIKEMLRYNELLDEYEKLLDKEKEEFYKLILDIDKIDCKEKIELYNKLKSRNIALMFYQDLRKIKDNSYKKIKNSLFKVYEHEELLNKEKSLKYKISIYELETEQFNMLISCRDNYSPTDCVRRHCYSFITDKNMKVFAKNRFIYGYIDFDLDNILHVFERDSYSSNGNGTSRNSFTTKCVNRIMHISQFSYVSRYSEFQIVNKKQSSNKFKVMKPSYLIVFDNIEDRHIEEAKRLNIPIIKINSKSYKFKKEVGYNQTKNKYVLNYERINDDYTDGKYKENSRKLRRICKS